MKIRHLTVAYWRRQGHEDQGSSSNSFSGYRRYMATCPPFTQNLSPCTDQARLSVSQRRISIAPYVTCQPAIHSYRTSRHAPSLPACPLVRLPSPSQHSTEDSIPTPDIRRQDSVGGDVHAEVPRRQRRQRYDEGQGWRDLGKRDSRCLSTSMGDRCEESPMTLKLGRHVDLATAKPGASGASRRHTSFRLIESLAELHEGRKRNFDRRVARKHVAARG